MKKNLVSETSTLPQHGKTFSPHCWILVTLIWCKRTLERYQGLTFSPSTMPSNALCILYKYPIEFNICIASFADIDGTTTKWSGPVSCILRCDCQFFLRQNYACNLSVSVWLFRHHLEETRRLAIIQMHEVTSLQPQVTKRHWRANFATRCDVYWKVTDLWSLRWTTGHYPRNNLLWIHHAFLFT